LSSLSLQEEGPRVKRSEQEIRDTLSEKFFDEKLDEVALCLEEWQKSGLSPEEHLKTEIYEKSIAYDNINNQLSSLIINNYNTFGPSLSFALILCVSRLTVPFLQCMG
jgi:hypothetical protein